MTCRVLVMTPDGCTMQVRALLDSASSASFVSNRLVQQLSLPRHHRQAQIVGVGGLTHQRLGQSVVCFSVAPLFALEEALQIEAFVLPTVTSNLPLHSVPFDHNWYHLSGICLADPDFGTAGNIDLLLGADVFSDVVLQGRRSGLSGSPAAFETRFGWVLTGAVDCKRGQSLTMLPSSQQTTSFENSGRLRNSALANLPCLLTNDLSCPTLKSHTVTMKPGDSLSLFREGLTRTPWGNPDRSLSEGLSRSNSH